MSGQIQLGRSYLHVVLIRVRTDSIGTVSADLIGKVVGVVTAVTAFTYRMAVCLRIILGVSKVERVCSLWKLNSQLLKINVDFESMVNGQHGNKCNLINHVKISW